MFSTKTGTAKLLLLVVVGLILLKAVVAWLTGSISILAQASDSLLDLFAGITTFFAVRISTKPADDEHPYGHGKVEDIGGMVQGILIFIASGLIIYSSIRRLVEGASIELTEAGMGSMLVSIVVSIFLSRHLSKVAKATNSVVLEANAHNIAADVYSASAVLVGLMAVRLTGLTKIDPIVAMGVAIYILKVAYDVAFKPLAELVDTRLPPSPQAIVETCLKEHSDRVVGFHKLRTRRAGSQCYIDLHLVMAKDISLEKAHEICEQIESEIEDILLEASVTIHAEPCGDECDYCSVVCSKHQG
jgi:cation diffusion facilitator family transporter